jgi:hypothetical protein
MHSEAEPAADVLRCQPSPRHALPPLQLTRDSSTRNHSNKNCQHHNNNINDNNNSQYHHLPPPPHPEASAKTKTAPSAHTCTRTNPINQIAPLNPHTNALSLRLGQSRVSLAFKQQPTLLLLVEFSASFSKQQLLLLLHVLCALAGDLNNV